jgi:Flp pilus assembly protein TadB
MSPLIIALLISAVILVSLFLLLGTFAGLIRPRRPEASPPRGRSRRLLDDIAQDLAEAGIEGLSPERFVAYSFVAGLGVGSAIILTTHWQWIALAVGVLIAFFGLRVLYVGRLAGRRRSNQMKHLIVAAREIAASIDAGANPDEALAQYARQIEDSSVESLTREPNQIAESIALALRLRATRGRTMVDALPESADVLGNKYYRDFIETYLRNERTNKAQLAEALRLFAEDVNYVVSLARELRNALNMPLMSYIMVGLVSLGMVVYMLFSVPTAGDFYGSDGGQLFAILAFGWWYLGFWFQRRKLVVRY